ncbi:MAG: dihydroorotate dehydrogenase electron transfer subunit [Armatimonadetes bacterium]|nr:dihydroorotate dehydrogenase electron transfer subunit [Armatimonadota bacterium]
MPHISARLTWNEEIGPGHHLMAAHAPQIAAAARPGQFLHVRVGPTHDPLLRRPFSVLRVDEASGQVWLLVKVVGRGTRLLAGMAPGAVLDVMGPLGCGFPEPPPGEEVALVAGGCGVAPLIFWADRIQTTFSHIRVVSILGAATEDVMVCWLDLAARSDEFYATTEDGSAGERGLASDALRGLLARRNFAAVYACGPRGMLKVCAELARGAGVPCFVAVEEAMACGVGACLGCVVPAAGGGYLRVCSDGPVFAAEALDWEALAT